MATLLPCLSLPLYFLHSASLVLKLLSVLCTCFALIVSSYMFAKEELIDYR